MLGKERIIIDPSNAQFQFKGGTDRYRTHSEVDTDRFVQSVIMMGKRSSEITELLPQNCRLYQQHYGVDFFVTEYPPMERTIRIDIDFSTRWGHFVKHCKENNMLDAIKYFKGPEGRKKAVKGFGARMFHIVVPYTVVVTEVTSTGRGFSCFIFFRNSPLSKLSDKIGKVPFYNINGDQRACFSIENRDTFYSKLSRYERVEQLVTDFWESHFNSDYTSNMRSYRYRMDVVNYFMWEYLSKTDPMRILQTKWIPMKENLIEFISKRMNRYGRHISSTPTFAGMKQAIRGI